MEYETYERIKKDLPIILVASAISLLSSTLYYSSRVNEKISLREVIPVIVYSTIATLILLFIVWVTYKITNLN